MLYNMLCCSALIFDVAIILNVMLMRKVVPHFVPCWHDY